MPAGIDGGGSHLVQRLFDCADAVGYVDLLPTLPDGEFWEHCIQNAAKGTASIIGFQSGDYTLAKRLDQGGGVGRQEDHLDVRVSQRQVPRVARSVRRAGEL